MSWKRRVLDTPLTQNSLFDEKFAAFFTSRALNLDKTGSQSVADSSIAQWVEWRSRNPKHDVDCLFEKRAKSFGKWH